MTNKNGIRQNLVNELNGKTAIFEGPDAVSLYRLQTILRGLGLEAKTGMKLSRGRSCYAIAKAEFGLRGSKQKVYEQLLDIYKKRVDEVEVRNEG